ncbi:MAG: 30S ribosomal protein S17 [Candidatus Doudnabacteria bacterium]|nr:30S ribosomal protein S17 [Candidatus Doudnabacteria bacterium]
MSKVKRRGEVVSDRMQKTVVVRVALQKIHPKYKKQYAVYRKYKAHHEGEPLKIGDIVEIEQAKPYSKTKRWVVVKKIE